MRVFVWMAAALALATAPSVDAAEPAKAAATKAALADDVLKAYLAIGDSLAADSARGVDKLAAELAASAGRSKLAGLEKAAQAMKTGSLADARQGYRAVSDAIIAAWRAAPNAAAKPYHCSMAKASWLQKPGKVRNPYYGSEMLECGGPVD